MPELLVNLNKLGLIEKLDGSDERFQKIEQAASALKDKFEAEPCLMIRAVLAALDPDIPANDPALIVAEEELLRVWKAMRSIHTDPPVQLYRSIILDACNQLAVGNNAVILWNTVADTLPSIRLGREEKVLTETILEWAYTAEEYSLIIPSLCTEKRAPSTKKIESLDFTPSQAKKVNQEALLKQVASSAGPQYRGNVLDGVTHNRYWAHNSTDWAFDFADIMTKILSTRLNTVNSNIIEAQNNLIEQLNQHEEHQIKSIQTLISNQRSWLQEVIANDQRSKKGETQRLNTLWWSEALYSPSHSCSYREIEPTLSTIIMAMDLLNEVESPTPASVSYTLSETVAKLPGMSFDKEYKISEVLDKICSKHSLISSNFSETITLPPESGRLSIRDLIVSCLKSTPENLSSLIERAGIDQDYSLPLPKLAQAFFRQEQAVRLAEVQV